MKTINYNFPSKEFFKKVTKKIAICLHHTTSGVGVDGDINWWEKDPRRVCTPVIVDREGSIHRLYSSNFWGHHLGIEYHYFRQFGLNPRGANVRLNKQTIGLEIDSWGGLVKRNGKYYSWTNDEVPSENVVYYPNGFRGYYYFEKYTTEQIQSVKELLIYWGDYYGIDLTYKGFEKVFDFNEDALSGVGGVFSHASFRPDKSDCHPQKELIEMLKTL